MYLFINIHAHEHYTHTYISYSNVYAYMCLCALCMDVWYKHTHTQIPINVFIPWLIGQRWAIDPYFKPILNEYGKKKFKKKEKRKIENDMMVNGDNENACRLTA